MPFLKSTNWLRRAHLMPAGISSGGGDTGFGRQPQKTLLTKEVSGAGSSDFRLPSGTVILQHAVIPSSEAAPTAGTVNLASIDPAVDYIVDGDATAYAFTAVTPAKLADDTRFSITTVGVPDGEKISVGFEVILPAIRS